MVADGSAVMIGEVSFRSLLSSSEAIGADGESIGKPSSSRYGLRHLPEAAPPVSIVYVVGRSE